MKGKNNISSINIAISPDINSLDSSDTSRSSSLLTDSLHDLNDETDQTLTDFTRAFCAKDVYTIFSEYTSLIRESTIEGQRLYNKQFELNRYTDVPCFDYSRVAVKHPTEDHDYIHANYVDGFCERRKFILTQAPLNQSIEQFWKMVWDEKTVMIVSMALMEDKRCSIYFPVEAADTKKFGPYEIKHAGTRHIRDAYNATILNVQKEGEGSRKLLHLLFYRWPDKGTPITPTEVLNFIEDMNYNRELMKKQAVADKWLTNESEKTPIVVHCVAGVGRSGSLVVLDILQRKLDASFLTAEGPMINIPHTIYRVRSQRALSVQKPEQFLFIHLSILEYALRKHYYSSVDFLNFANYMQQSEES